VPINKERAGFFQLISFSFSVSEALFQFARKISLFIHLIFDWLLQEKTADFVSPPSQLHNFLKTAMIGHVIHIHQSDGPYDG
jgi:hypothetical protein